MIYEGKVWKVQVGGFVKKNGFIVYKVVGSYRC